MPRRMDVRAGTSASTEPNLVPAGAEGRPREDLRAELNRPISTWKCVLGWVAATAIFLGLVALFGGPSGIDTSESVYGTWAVAHGSIGCVYPTATLVGEPPIAPLYLVLSGGIAAVAGVGDRVPFPSAAALGAHCDREYAAMDRWSVHSGALRPTSWIGCVAWLALMAGVVIWLRAAGRGRNGWEPLTLVIVACLVPVWMCVQSYFHPQDLLAMGLGLSAMACGLRGRWIAAGILCAMAVLSQQFALLVAAPLFVLAPSTRRISFAVAAVVTGAIAVLPLVALTSGHALHAIAVGTGDNAAEGGTVFWHLNLSGVQLVLLSRVAPIAAAIVLSWWVLRRLGPAALEPTSLISVVAVSLGLRLVFEQNLYSYYYMALAVSLVLLDVTRGVLRGTVVAWLTAMTLVICALSLLPFGAVSWGLYWQNDLVPLVLGAFALLVLLVQFLRGKGLRVLWPWIAVAAIDLLILSFVNNPLVQHRFIWFWQVILVVPGILLAFDPLRVRIRRASAERPGDDIDRLAPTGGVGG